MKIASHQAFKGVIACVFLAQRVCDMPKRLSVASGFNFYEISEKQIVDAINEALLILFNTQSNIKTQMKRPGW